MKKVKITITGDILGVDYSSKSSLNEEGEYDFNFNYYSVYGWEKVNGMYVDAPDDISIFDEYANVVKQKGKYAKTKEYFHNLWKEDGDHPLPVEIHTRTWYDQYVDYIIELEDDEEFDIKKVQLLKSDYECAAFPYFIIAEYILYDGKEVEEVSDICDYDVESKLYDEQEVTELYG